jgi:nucleotide-binding universal stress UspA family protein
MSGIVCAVRGGPQSRATIAQAIGLARRTGLPVHFVYVLNQELVPGAGIDHARAVEHQVKQLGESVLFAAQALANSQGVCARGSTRQGSVEDEIASACGDLNVEYLVLGRPGRRRGTRSSPISTQFAEQIRNQVGIEIVWSESSVGRTVEYVRGSAKEGKPCSSP